MVLDNDFTVVGQKNGEFYMIPDTTSDIKNTPNVLGHWNARHPSVRNMTYDTVKKFNITEDFEIKVFVTDRMDHPLDEKNTYGYTITGDNYKKGFPDHMYYSWPEIGVEDYTKMINSFVDTAPRSRKIGWIGHYTCGWGTPRPKAGEMSKNCDWLEIIDMQWTEVNENMYKNTPKYMSYQEQIDRWKYLIDFEGCGWSARLKVLLSSPRIVFFVDRMWKEWWFEHLVPWKHYVPVKRDLSDLEENYNLIENDVGLQKYIKTEIKKFSDRYLTIDAAHNRIKEIINENIKQ